MSTYHASNSMSFIVVAEHQRADLGWISSRLSPSVAPGAGASPWSPVVRETPASWGRTPRAPFLSPAWTSGDLPALPPAELALAGLRQLRHGAALEAYLDLALGREVALFMSRWSI